MKYNKNIDLHKDPIKSLIFKMTLPTMFAGLLTTSYSFIDMIFASRLGSVQVASIAFVTPLFMMLQAIAIGVTRGGVSIIAKYLGEKDRDSASAYATNLRLMIYALAGFFSIFGILFAPTILSLIKISDELYDQALIYTRILFYSMPFSLTIGLYMTLFKSQGKMEITSRISLIGVLSNIVLNSICIYVLKMGIEGLAYASLATKIIQAVVIVIMFHSSNHDFKIGWRTPGRNDIKDIWLKLLKVGLPLSISLASFNFGNLFLNIFIVHYGHEAVAAFAIGNRINSLLFMPSKELGQGLIPLLAQNWGRKAMNRVKETIKYGLIFSVSFGLIAAFIIQIIKYPLAQLLTNGETVTYGYVLDFVGLVGWTVIAWAIFNTLQAIFNGFQKTSFILITNLVRLWGLRLPGVLFFQHFIPSVAEYGVWYTMFFSNTLTLVFAAVYFIIKIPPMLILEPDDDKSLKVL